MLQFLLLFVARQGEEDGENGFQIALVYLTGRDVVQWNAQRRQQSQASGDVINLCFCCTK